MSKLTVYLADDHTIFRQVFVKILKESKKIDRIKEASDGKELLALIEEEIPDLVIIDIEMPKMGGLLACKKINEQYPEIKIIVLSMHEQKHTINQALQFGADAFLPKVAKLEEFEAALNAIIDCKPYTNALMDEALQYNHVLRKSKEEVIPIKVDFSEKEKAIIELICKEFTNRQIAQELSLSEHTVRNHKVRIMRKAKVKNVQGLVKFAVENGFSPSL